MSTATNQTTAVPSNTKRIILASAYRQERRSTNRQERACKALRKIGRVDDYDAHDSPRVHRISSADEVMDD